MTRASMATVWKHGLQFIIKVLYTSCSPIQLRKDQMRLHCICHIECPVIFGRRKRPRAPEDVARLLRERKRQPLAALRAQY